MVGKALAYARPHNADDFATPNKKGFVNRLIYDIDLFDGRSPVLRGRGRYKDNKDRAYTREQKIALRPMRIVERIQIGGAPKEICFTFSLIAIQHIAET